MWQDHVTHGGSSSMIIIRARDKRVGRNMVTFLSDRPPLLRLWLGGRHLGAQSKKHTHGSRNQCIYFFFFCIQHSPIQILLRINTWALIPSTIMALQEYKGEPQTTPSWPATGEQHIYYNKLLANLGEGGKKKKKKRGWEGDTGIGTHSSFRTLDSIVKQERGGEHGVPYILHCPWSLQPLLIDNSC